MITLLIIIKYIKKMLCWIKTVMTFFKTGGNDYVPVGGIFLYFFYLTAIIVGTT